MKQIRTASIESQMVALIKSHLKQALPERKSRFRRSIPLWAFIRGAVSIDRELRGIDAIRSQDFKWINPYTSFYVLSQVSVDRLLKSRQVTHIQREMLVAYSQRRHRGFGEFGSLHRPGVYDPKDYSYIRDSGEAVEAHHLLQTVMRKLKLFELPIKTLLDEQFTNLILLSQLDFLLSNKRREA